MQNAWSRPTGGADPARSDSLPTPAQAGVDATSDSAPGEHPDSATATDRDLNAGEAVRTADPGDPTTVREPSGQVIPGEDEAHRTAVDSVDGLLDEVERALARLDDGTYGRCEACGEPIDDRRLEESPVTRNCSRADCREQAGEPGSVSPALA